MSWMAAAVVGSAVVGGAMSASASKSAGKAQAGAASTAAEAQLQASREANELQQEMYRQNMATTAPSLQAGQTALAALQRGLGLGQLRASQSQVDAPAESIAQIRQRLTPGFRGAYGGNNIDDVGLDAAALDEFNAQNRARSSLGAGGVTGGMPGAGYSVAPGITGVQNYGATQGELDRGAGSLRSGQLTEGMPADFTQDPSYQFRLRQGQRALEAGAAARGGLLTGQGGADLLQYGQGEASKEYGAAFDRHRATQGDLYNRLAALAGVAQTGAGAAGGYGTGAADAMSGNITGGAGAASGYLTSGAQAQAQGGVNAAGAWQGALNTGLNSWATLQGMNRGLTPGGQGYNYYPATSAAAQGQLYGPPAPVPYTG
jgi:hypothetical protein